MEVRVRATFALTSWASPSGITAAVAASAKSASHHGRQPPIIRRGTCDVKSDKHPVAAAPYRPELMTEESCEASQSTFPNCRPARSSLSAWGDFRRVDCEDDGAACLPGSPSPGGKPLPAVCELVNPIRRAPDRRCYSFPKHCDAVPLAAVAKTRRMASVALGRNTWCASANTRRTLFGSRAHIALAQLDPPPASSRWPVLPAAPTQGHGKCPGMIADRML